MTINFNVAPYYDDYDEQKNFYRILFKPGVAVQARELTQLQTILQKQVERFGKHVFKEGSMVIPGQASIDTDIGYVKLQTGYTGSLENYVGKTLTESSTGLTADVVTYSAAEGADPATLFVKYKSSGTLGNVKTFSNNSVIQNAGESISATTALSTATGTGSIASIQSGVYFVKNNFVLVSNATIVLDKYSNAPSYRIGLTIDEDFVTEEDDATLKDNATGSTNEAAPGAHRYRIQTTLAKLSLTSTLDEDFIELIRVENGVIKREVRATEYSVLEQTLARRTFDESGNYTVSPFQIQVREHRNNYRGDQSNVSASASLSNIKMGDVALVDNVYYVAPADSGTPITTKTTITSTWTQAANPFFNRGIYSAEQGGDSAKLAIGLEPGKAYVQGYEIQKIATEYLPIDKPRSNVSVTNAQLQTVVGNYVKVANLYATSSTVSDVLSFAQVNLYDRLQSSRGTNAGNVIGTARVRLLTYDSGNADTANAVFKLSLFDVSMNNGSNFNRNVKAIGGTNIKADVDPVLITLKGTVTAAASTTVVGSGTDFVTELVVGDYIYTAFPDVAKRRVTAIANAQYLTVDSALTATNATVSRIETEILEADRISLVYPLPFQYIKSLSGLTYTQYKKYTGTANSAGIAVLTHGGSNPTGYLFNSSITPSDIVAVNTTSGNLTDGATAVYVSSSPNQLEISGLTASANFDVLVPVYRDPTASQKSKTITNKTETFTLSSVYGAKEITLANADIIAVSNVIMANTTGSFTGTGITNITDWFTLDDGQRSTHYAQGRLIKKPGYPTVSANIQVNYSYYTHGSGDFFAVGSYPNMYEQIPSFNGIRLSDVLDFRPTIDASGTTQSSIPAIGFETEFDYAYYLGRKDKIAIDLNGNFFNIQGVPAIITQDPADPTVGMVLYKLDLKPYTITTTPKDVGISYIDNKRYTMRDIGRLEKRIENIEYYTALSLLEQETKSQTILDANNLDRFKNGFIVDSFEGQGIGDTSSVDYRCAIDMENKELRPFHVMNNINMLLSANSGTVKTGDVVTLPYSHSSIVTQPYASRTENVNPFAIAAFNGTLTLTPQSDEWFETQRRPEIVVNEEGNFEAIRTVAEASGVLGTVWNAWQTQWTGTPVSTSVRSETAVLQSGVGLNFDQRFGAATRRDTAAFDPNVGLRTVTLATQATAVGQARTGVRTTVVARSDRRVIDDRQLSLATIPFIRSRTISFLARGLKPSTVFYPYFDDQSITSYVTPATKVSLSSINGTFDYVTNVEMTEAAVQRNPRRVDGNPDAGFNKGDVVYVSKGAVGGSEIQIENSPATGVVAFYETTNGNVLHLVNVKGNFQNGNVITGTISGANAVINGAVTVKVAGDQLITTSAGDVAGAFTIPNTNSVRFRTGVREFKLTDSTSNGADFTSVARSQYTAQGLLETRQATIASVRNAEFVRESVSETTTVIQTGERVVGDTGWYDPLAQTFLVQQKGGAFLTKLDVYFSAKDDTLPITLEVREVVNGYPGKRVLPFSRTVLSADQVTVSTDAATPTTFTFRSPVYVQENQEYCVVLLTDSTKYRVWISQIGETAVGSDRIISQQPYAGVLFKSQNASTWTADQLQDLKFTLYRAAFTTGATGTVTFNNEKISTELLQSNPFQTKSGSPVIRVLQRNHGMQASSTVTLSGVTDNVFGIHSSDLNKTHTIANVLIDSYTITVANSATATTVFGGANVKATRNFAYNTLQPIVQYQDFSDTTISFVAKTTSGQSPSGSESANVFDSTGVSVLANENNDFSTTRMVVADQMRTPSLQLIASLSSDNDSLSPVIDLNRTSAILVNNRLDNPSSTFNNEIDNRTVISANTNISLAGNVISTTNGGVANVFATVGVGKLLTVTSNAVPTNNVTYTVTAVSVSGATGNITLNGAFTSEAAGNLITLVVGENFINEIAPLNGSTASKYITKQINLNYPSTFLKIQFAASVPTDAEVDVYYKALPLTSTPTETVNFVQVSPTTTFPKSDDPFTFRDVSYEVENIPAFTAVVVKLVFRSTSSSAVPLVKDLRVIACA